MVKRVRKLKSSDSHNKTSFFWHNFGLMLLISLFCVGAIPLLICIFLPQPFNFFLATLLFALLIVSFVFLLYKNAISPIRNITKALEKIESGDYSARVRAEKARGELADLIVQLNKILDDFEKVDTNQRALIANVSHELRTPIAALMAQIENLADGIVPVNTASLDVALKQVTRLSDLVSFLLDLSRLDARAAVLDQTIFDLGDFLEDSIEPLRTFEGAKTLNFIIDIVPQNLTIRADKNRFQQVIANLVANAIKHTPQNSDVYITGRREQDVVLIAIEDSGSGILHEDRNRVFKRFVQGTPTTSQKMQSEGTGIGLAIVKWAVELHGGTISLAQSKTGARFEIRMPNTSPRHRA
ncbi:MAG: HAMP domain-containing histidine kinase [Bifidobacteriaceae bacterium]|jgi:signal transduction histidine kinase|nr:HAMP domain-containing histidine kinase [Bifidobacteriaceae bacterium]